MGSPMSSIPTIEDVVATVTIYVLDTNGPIGNEHAIWSIRDKPLTEIKNKINEFKLLEVGDIIDL